MSNLNDKEYIDPIVIDESEMEEIPLECQELYHDDAEEAITSHNFSFHNFNLISPFTLPRIFKYSPQSSLKSCKFDVNNDLELIQIEGERTKSDPNSIAFHNDKCLSTKESERSLQKVQDVHLCKQILANTVSTDCSLPIEKKLLTSEKEPQLLNCTNYCHSPAMESRISAEHFCRICHEGDALENFISPCKCAGSMALVHKSCMEKWLSTSSREAKCELCNSTIIVISKPKSVIEYVTEEGNSRNRTALCGDAICLLIMTPIIIWGSFICIKGILDYLPDGALYKHPESMSSNGKEEQINYEKMETDIKKTAGIIAALIIICIILIVSYFGWLIVAMRFHIKKWKFWRTQNYRINLV